MGKNISVDLALANELFSEKTLKILTPFNTFSKILLKDRELAMNFLVG